MPNDRFPVFLVAGNRLLREALARLLNRRGDFDVCGVSACVTNTASSIAASAAEVLILDSVSARLSDCAFISQIVSQVPNIRVVLIAAEVVSGVQRVAKGQAVCPPQLCLHLFRAFSRQWPAVPTARIKIEFGLTRRQQQIVPLIAQGLTNKEIASHLSLSEQTVKNHIHGIMRRVGAVDRLQVIDLTHFSGAPQ